MAVPGPGGRRRSLWQWSPGGYHLIRLEAVPFTAGSVPDLLAAFQIGATFADIRVVSLAGGEARVLLSARGGGVEVLAGSPPGLAFKHHDTGGSGTWVVWQWDADLGQLVRADGSFTAFYRQQAAGVPLKPAGAAWVDYYAAITYLQAGEDADAPRLAQQGFHGVGYMHDSPAFLELEATVRRREGDCTAAVPLFQEVVTAASPGGGIGWPALARSYYGLAECARATGDTAQARSYARRAIAAASPANDRYGYAQAEALLKS